MFMTTAITGISSRPRVVRRHDILGSSFRLASFRKMHFPFLGSRTLQNRDACEDGEIVIEIRQPQEEPGSNETCEAEAEHVGVLKHIVVPKQACSLGYAKSSEKCGGQNSEVQE